MKGLSDYLRAFVANAPIPRDGEVARNVIKASTLIKQHIVEIELAFDYGLEAQELLCFINEFVKPGKEITQSHLNNSRYKFRREVNNLALEKEKLLMMIQGGAQYVPSYNADTHPLRESTSMGFQREGNDHLISGESSTVLSKEVESESIESNNNKVTNPTELRNLRRNSEPDFR